MMRSLHMQIMGAAWACRYKNIDKLIHYANKEGRINVFYSTPAAYTAAKHSYNQSWALKTDDFFPYADNPYSYWTGGPASLRSSQLTPFLLCKWWLPCISIQQFVIIRCQDHHISAHFQSHATVQFVYPNGLALLGWLCWAGSVYLDFEITAAHSMQCAAQTDWGELGSRLDIKSQVTARVSTASVSRKSLCLLKVR